MKTNMTKLIMTLTAVTLGLGAFAQQQDRPVEDNTPTPQNNPDQQEMVAELIQAVVEAQQAVGGENAAEGGTNQALDARSPRPIRGQGTRGTMGSSTNAISLTTFLARQSTNGTAATAPRLRLNFRNAPLSLVLDYLSEAAGFTISANSKVDLKGAVTVWSNQPVDRNQAVQILHQALGEHHYAATVEGNVLNIYVVDASSTEIAAGVPDNDYLTIPATQDLVTQIVYVHNVEPSQLITSLQPLMPNGTSMTPNQGANAIVITDTKANIRRMVQLVKALDTTSVSASTLEVFALTFADAATLAQVVQQVFQADSGSSRQGGGGLFGGMFPGGFPGGDRGRGQSSGSSSPQAGRVASAKVVAVADDRSNSLVVSASEDQMARVRQLVKQMDVNVDDVTELRVFRLKFADPQETADQLTSLFPDPTAQQNSRTGGGFRGFSPFGGPPGSSRGGSSSTDPNSRKLLQARVTAVPDPRTGSVIVSASRDMMPQIGDIIEQLDSDPAKKKKVYVIKVENRDPQEVVEDLQGVFATDTSGNFNSTRSSRQSGTQLGTRQQNNLRNTGTTSSQGSSFGSSSGSRTGR